MTENHVAGGLIPLLGTTTLLSTEPRPLNRFLSHSREKWDTTRRYCVIDYSQVESQYLFSLAD